MAREPQLNWRLTLEERQRVADGAGGFTEAWTTLGQLWGEIQTRSAAGGGLDGGPSSRVRHRITVRGAPEGSAMRPKIGQRMRTGTRLFEVKGVGERDATGIYLDIWAEEEVLA